MEISRSRHIQCYRLPQLERDLKNIGKKHRTVGLDLGYAETLLAKGLILPQTNQYPGFKDQHTIMKTRVVNTGDARGKSSGYRLIYEILPGAPAQPTTLLLIYIYPKKGNDNEANIKEEILSRIRSPEYKELTTAHH